VLPIVSKIFLSHITNKVLRKGTLLLQVASCRYVGYNHKK